MGNLNDGSTARESQVAANSMMTHCYSQSRTPSAAGTSLTRNIMEGNVRLTAPEGVEPTLVMKDKTVKIEKYAL